MTEAVVQHTTLPIIVKLTPNVTDIVAVAKAVVDAGADALCLINTMPAMTLDAERQRPELGWGSGGLSGPALRPIALRLVWKVADQVDVPIIGCGGITSAHDVLEYFMAGASAIQVGTATFINPRASLDVLEGLEHYMREREIVDVRDLIGVAPSYVRRISA